ncbi:MAG: molybdopterin-guanine dinucleotide biosynthesis protein B [Lamprobacter sp.]|uniref:molybdopterin-guanine dinucleotide biosynthesis protein B n=1 Tax=Lamprobacter sp. TaxID=3100796 RepID=UPI002B259096|nr:molybdopterin-guanine dinucleotide biosynthesis protein B [Lamprobacter sp.]MEA3640082.1 molybdopterin-guanine dinucleotide biosynthesis protein B [Lamprobacter sp.]
MMDAAQIPAIGFVAPSGSGKTTLLRKLVPLLRQRGLRIGYLKHAHHGFALDRPGKDSYEVAAAGARQVMLVSGEHWALLSRTNERAEDHPAGLDSLRARFDAESLDLLLIEGFRAAAVPKIEVFRTVTGKAPLYPDDPGIVAVVSDDPLPVEPHPRQLPLSELGALVDFIAELARTGAGISADPRAELLAALQRWQGGWANAAAFGNASVRAGGQFWITPSGWVSPNGRPGDLGQADALIPCGLDAPLPEAVCADAGLSLDAELYREVYRQRPEINAILRTQGPQVVALSLRLGSHQGLFEPLDEQGRSLFGRVPVLAPPQLAAALAQNPLCLVVGQGVYAAAADINEAYRLSLALELSAQIALLS